MNPNVVVALNDILTKGTWNFNWNIFSFDGQGQFRQFYISLQIGALYKDFYIHSNLKVKTASPFLF